MGIPIPHSSPSCSYKFSALQDELQSFQAWADNNDTQNTNRLRFSPPPARQGLIGVYRNHHDDDDEEDEDEDEHDDDMPPFEDDDDVWVDPTGGVLTRLFNLSSDGKLDDLTSLLRSVDSHIINLQGPDGDTALHLASVYGQEDVVRCLLENGADPTVTDDDHALALHDAASGGHMGCARLLLQAAPWTINALDEDGDTPLHNAARADNTEMVQFLLSRGASASISNRLGCRPLDVVERNGSLSGRTHEILQHAVLVCGSAAASVA